MKTAITAALIGAAAIAAGACTSSTTTPAAPASASHKSTAPLAGPSSVPGARFAELAATYRVQTGLDLPPQADALARKICRPKNLLAARISYRLSYKAVRKGTPSKAAYFIVDAIDTYCPGIKN